jgi:DNA-directed RNA polymerase II subunit RPB9
MSNLFEDDDIGFHEQVEYRGIRFCPECGAMMSPKDHQGRLGYECPIETCRYEMVVEDQFSVIDNLVSRKEFQKEDKNIIIDQEYAMDPTMPREKKVCPECAKDDVVFFISSDNEDTKIVLIYICCNPECGHHWRKEVEE